MNWESLLLFSVGFCFLMAKRTVVGILCGLQICAIALISFCVAGGADSLAVGFVILICSGLFGAIGISVLSRNGLKENKTRE